MMEVVGTSAFRFLAAEASFAASTHWLHHTHLAENRSLTASGLNPASWPMGTGKLVWGLNPRIRQNDSPGLQPMPGRKWTS